MKRPILIVIVLALLVGGVTVGVSWYDRQSTEPTDVLVLHGNIDIRQVELAFNSSGRIDRMLAHEGDRVARGDLLAVLDEQRLALNVAQAEAQVAVQQQVVARNAAGSRPEEIRKARADADAARAAATNAERAYRRVQDLVARDFVSQQQLDTAKAEADAAAARLESAEQALRLVMAGPRKEDVAAAVATLRAYQTALAVARRDLEEASLHAPSDGVVQNRLLEPGDLASPQKPVYTLAIDDPLWVRAYLSESDLGKVRPGMLAEISSDSHPDKRYRGWVGFISSTAEFTPKAVETREVRTSLVYQVRIFVCAPRGELRLGMPVDASISFDQPAPASPGPRADPCQTPA